MQHLVKIALSTAWTALKNRPHADARIVVVLQWFLALDFAKRWYKILKCEWKVQSARVVDRWSV